MYNDDESRQWINERQTNSVTSMTWCTT